MSTEELSRSHSREGSKEPEVICAVCSNFEPQAWRKKYCKNCFHSLEEHTADAEKETVHDKIENEKNAKNKAEEKTETDSKLLKDKLLKDDKNKSNQSSADKSQPPKQDKKTTSIADKFNKKSDGVATDNKSKTTETDKTSASDKIKGKIESSNQSNTSKDKTEDKIKTSGTKSKSDTKLETSKATESKADSVKQDEKSKQEADKSKTSGLKSKFESKTQNEEKKESSNDKEKREPETKPGVKQFKVPEPKDSKMKWKDMWGSTLQNRQKQEKEKEREKASASSEDKDKKSDTNAKVTDKTDEKDSGKPSSGNEKKNDSIRGKFESKDSGNLWGAKLKPKSENKTVEKDSDKIKPEDKQLSKEEEKHKVDNKQIKDDKPWNKNIKDKSSQKELESPKPKTDETKSKQMDKKDESKSIDKKEDVKTGNEQKKLWGPKSKFDSNKSNKSEESKVTKTFGVGLKKPETKDSKPPDEDKLKSENDNQKNEKLEGKLKLDIKKAEEANKADKESGHSDWRKAKYEKLSKTPTTISPGKNNEQKGYSRSKSDTSIKAEEDKKSQDVHNIKTPEVKPQSRFGSSIKSPEVKSQPKDDKIKPAKSPVTPIDVTTSKQVETSDKKDIKSSKDKKDDFSDIDIEVKDDGPSRSSSKLNTDAINKIKEAAKFLLDDDFDDDKYNSIGRKGIGNKAVTSQQATPSLVSSATDRSGLDKRLIQGTTIISNSSLGKNEVESAFNEKFNSETERLRKQLKQMEEKCQELEEENKNLKNGLVENEKHSGRLVKQKQDVENSIKVLQKNLTSIETKCTKLESENAKLIENIKIMKAKCESSTAEDLKAAHMEELNLLRNKLQEGENIVEELREDNENLKQEILDLKNEMEEMYDTFRDQEAEEFREIQREMEMHAKNCRVLSFKLRKYERMNEQLEAEKENYEDKITALQNQISDGDTRSHVRDIEDELRLAKEVSVRLHDELDILEEKKCKLEEENSQITRILEQSDKKQFRLELEVDKLRDQVTELKKTKTAPGTPVSQDDSKARRF